MNEYNYEYETINNNITNRNYQKNMIPNYMQSEILNNINYLPNLDNSQIKMMNTNNQILEPYQGFIRGNLFNNLYDKYKNYKPAEINPTNEKEALLEQWQQYNFALTDLDLYLDIHPNDQEAINLYNKYLNIKNQIANNYEKMYGPLSLNSEYTANKNWNWINSPWPWEVIK